MLLIHPLEVALSVNIEKKRLKSSALPWFVTSRVQAVKRVGLSEAEQACLALEADGIPCPMDVGADDWVRMNFSYICTKYKEKYPKPISYTKKLPKIQANPGRKATAKKATRSLAAPTSPVASNAFLSTYEWRKVRMMALKKYGARCQCCGASPKDGAVMNVDHIKPRKLFPDLALDLSNLQILCHECNHGKGNWDKTDWR